MVREIRTEELSSLLALYLFLHEESIPEITGHLGNTWNLIMNDANHHIVLL